MRASPGPWDTCASSPGLRPQSALHTALQRECCLPETAPSPPVSFLLLTDSFSRCASASCLCHRDPVVNWVHQASNTDRHEPNAPMNVPALGWHVFLPWGEWGHRGQNLPRCKVGCPFVPISRGKHDCDPCSVFPLDLVFPPNSSF